MEYSRLIKAVTPENENLSNKKEQINILCKKMGNLTIICKGQNDLICNGTDIILECSEEHQPRRCGGQGDILAGALGTFQHWSVWAKERGIETEIDGKLLAAYGACLMTKGCAKDTFEKFKRGTTTPDMLHQIPFTFERLFPLDG